MKVTRSFFKPRYFYSQIRRLLLKTRQLLMKSRHIFLSTKTGPENHKCQITESVT